LFCGSGCFFARRRVLTEKPKIYRQIALIFSKIFCFFDFFEKNYDFDHFSLDKSRYRRYNTCIFPEKIGQKKGSRK